MSDEETNAADRGRSAAKPSGIPARGWKDIVWRVFKRFFDDRIGLIAAGVAFYILLGLFPALTAFVSLYGFLFDPQTIAEQVSYLRGLLPSGGIEVIREQLQSLASQDRNTLSIGFAAALLVAFWSANNGVKTLFEAVNVAYRESEKRSILKTNIIAFAFTVGAMMLIALMAVSAGIVPLVLSFLHLDRLSESIIVFGRWPIIFVVVVFSISLIYRFGPSRAPAKWRWISWGSVLATTVWIAASAAFSFYLQNFANYNATYGSLGAAIGLMLWAWLSALILIVGAEVNAEMEHQTTSDSTTGEPQPMGKRGAVVADTLGRSFGGSTDHPE
ncbi:MAG: YihY/virulence factor BrkB family protein [Rhizobiaceae bacterium]